MEPNPYESPCEAGGYRWKQSNQYARLKDFLACVGCAILIHAVIQGVIVAAVFFGFLR